MKNESRNLRLWKRKGLFWCLASIKYRPKNVSIKKIYIYIKKENKKENLNTIYYMFKSFYQDMSYQEKSNNRINIQELLWQSIMNAKLGFMAIITGMHLGLYSDWGRNNQSLKKTHTHKKTVI